MCENEIFQRIILFIESQGRTSDLIQPALRDSKREAEAF